MALVEEWLGTIKVASTRRAYRSDLASFYRWACKRGLVRRNPVEDTDTIRVPKGLPRPVDAGLVADLITLAPDWETQIAIALAAYAGLRRSEIACLRRDDIAVESMPPVLIVRGGKGGKDRVVPIHPHLLRLLIGLPAGYVCPSKSQAIGKKVAKHMRELGIDATIHQLRHTFATEAYRSSHDLRAVQDLLGHESPTTTTVYTQLDGSMLQATVAGMYGGGA